MSGKGERLPHHIETLEHSVCTKYSKRLVMFQIAWPFHINVKEKQSTKRVIGSRARSLFQHYMGLCIGVLL